MCCTLTFVLSLNPSLSQRDVPNAKIGFSKAMSAGWLRIDKKAEGGPRLYRKVDSIDDKVQEMLHKVSQFGEDGIPSEQLKEFKKRKLVSNV